ncbi:DUF2304 domain-containing protein [Dermabacter sp. HSID17554]|uniref:DUF2304 domain-containing protein n=1 Tax=Dermabacter sp. HSID17554 TaxID=2419511 RepID=UPI00129415F0|nr:DUF2304 domain-containing protein [Dermabacter sp. HSID17554]
MRPHDALATVLASPVGVVVENRTLIIQILLILGIISITAWLFIKRGARQLAIRRLIILAFMSFAVLAVIFPTSVTTVARFVGVGRGTDLLLYATVVVLLGLIALQEARTKTAEKRTTKLARKVAVAEAESPEAYRNHALTSSKNT